MKFGLFVEWPNPGLRDWRTLFEEGVRQIQYAEEMGYDYVFIAEHHFSNYGMTPAPLVEAMYIAQRTSRIRIVTTSVVLPEWPALRLAEELAVLDNLTGGRLICGVGRGYQPYELMRHGVAYEHSHKRFEETLEVLKLAWTSEKDFTYDGEQVKVPHPVCVWPKPLQKPHPPIWITTGSEAQIAKCAQNDIVPLVSARMGPQSIEPAAVAWVQGRAAVGRGVEGYELGMQCPGGCADTEAKARELIQYFRWQTRANRALQRLAIKDGQADAIPFDGEDTDEQSWERLYFGTPDMLIDKWRRGAAHGASMVSTWLLAGGIPHELVMNAIRLIGREVIPALRDVRPDPEWLAGLAARPNATARASGKLGGQAE